MTYISQDKNPKKHAEFLQLFNRLKEQKVEYKNLDTDNLAGIGLYKKRLLNFGSDIGKYWKIEEHITYIMNPIILLSKRDIMPVVYFLREGELVNDLDFILCTETLDIERIASERTWYERTGILGLIGPKIQKNELNEWYIDVNEYWVKRLEIQSFLPNRIIYPLYDKDLEELKK